jgi:hypothetical protein
MKKEKIAYIQSAPSKPVWQEKKSPTGKKGESAQNTGQMGEKE